MPKFLSDNTIKEYTGGTSYFDQNSITITISTTIAISNMYFFRPVPFQLPILNEKSS
jgi:hypothetical protein